MKLKRVEEKDIMECYHEDTFKRKFCNATTKHFTPYVVKKKKEKIPIYPCITYNLKEI